MTKKIPFALVILSMVMGVFISILFGVNESLFKNKISKDLHQNQKIMSIADVGKREAKLKKESDKNWRYYQRFHFHSTGISAMSMGTLIVLAFSAAPAVLVLISSYMISVGGILYPFIWLFAGMYGPIMGRSAAKEAFAIFGYMGGVYLIGLIIALFIVVKHPLKFNKD